MSATSPEALPHGFPFRFVERALHTEDGVAALVLGTADGASTGTLPWPVGLVAEALAQAILVVVRPERMVSPG